MRLIPLQEYPLNNPYIMPPVSCQVRAGLLFRALGWCSRVAITDMSCSDFA